MSTIAIIGGAMVDLGRGRRLALDHIEAIDVYISRKAMVGSGFADGHGMLSITSKGGSVCRCPFATVAEAEAASDQIAEALAQRGAKQSGPPPSSGPARSAA